MTTSERAEAYGRVMKALSDLGPGKLHEDEQATVREAADSLLFSETLDGEARQALVDLEDLSERLITADRLSSEAVERLVRDVEACGPAVPAF